MGSNTQRPRPRLGFEDASNVHVVFGGTRLRRRACLAHRGAIVGESDFGRQRETSSLYSKQSGWGVESFAGGLARPSRSPRDTRGSCRLEAVRGGLNERECVRS